MVSFDSFVDVWGATDSRGRRASSWGKRREEGIGSEDGKHTLCRPCQSCRRLEKNTKN